MLLLLLLDCFLVGMFIWVSVLQYRIEEVDEGTMALSDTAGTLIGMVENNLNRTIRDNKNTSREDVNRLEVQFALLVDALGYKFEPEKSVETHQGDNHEVKVTPARFVKSRSR